MTTKNGNAAPLSGLKITSGLFFDLLRRLVLEKPLGTFGLGLIIIFTMGFLQFICVSWSQIHLLERLQARPAGTFWAPTNWARRAEPVDLRRRISMEIASGHLFKHRRQYLIGALRLPRGKTDMMCNVLSMSGCPSRLRHLTHCHDDSSRSLLMMILVLGITAVSAAPLGQERGYRHQSNTYIGLSAIAVAGAHLLVHIIPNIMPTLIIMFTWVSAATFWRKPA